MRNERVRKQIEECFQINKDVLLSIDEIIDNIRYHRSIYTCGAQVKVGLKRRNIPTSDVVLGILRTEPKYYCLDGRWGMKS